MQGFFSEDNPIFLLCTCGTVAVLFEKEPCIPQKSPVILLEKGSAFCKGALRPRMEKLHSERHEKHTATHTATHRNALKHADIALQTPRTEFWRFGWYYYSTNCAANMELLVLLA